MPAEGTEPLLALRPCPSSPHHTVPSLLRAAAGLPVDTKALVADVRATQPDDLVQIAVYHDLHTVVATGFEHAPEATDGFPDDLVIFFTEMRVADLRRSEKIPAQLLAVGEVFLDLGIAGM